ncbi:MAG: hypothetical protein LUG89_05215 [Methanosphaera sp.]|nr:hypothetical protein [Methanosphaera sp.]
MNNCPDNMKYINYKTNDSHVGVLEDDIIYRLDYPCIIDAIRDKLDVLESYKNNPTDNISDV